MLRQLLIAAIFAFATLMTSAALSSPAHLHADGHLPKPADLVIDQSDS